MTAGSSSERPADPEVVEKIIHELKSKGYFDQFRKEFVADADTKVTYFRDLVENIVIELIISLK